MPTEARSKLSLASATSLLMFYLRQSGFFGYKKDSRDKEPLKYVSFQTVSSSNKKNTKCLNV